MISLDRQIVPSNKVNFYADRVINDLKIKEPPVLYNPVLEYFGLELKPIDEQIELKFMELMGSRDIPNAFLLSANGKGKVYVKQYEKQPRKRLSIFHECAHHDLPWHSGHDFFCNCYETDHNHNKEIEREAFEYAANLIFPGLLFFDDIHSMPIQFQTIEILAKRYNASFAATAINFVKKTPEKCALILLKFNPNYEEGGAPFCVDYSIISRTFRQYRFWEKGALIFYNDYIMSCFEHKRSWECEIPACVFGSNKELIYKVNLRHYGDGVFALLHIPNRQTSLFGRFT